MRAFIEAGQEPYLTAFNKLKASPYSSTTALATDRGTRLNEGKFNGTVGVDGRRAHDLALLWHLTGEEIYARKAVEFINANSHYVSTSWRGTGPLDNGKVYLLIEAAELMRDYEGWKPAERQRFADMLTYPYYSSDENVADKFASLDDDQNGITFYWNCFNFDASRHGNQGLFAARALMAMGIFLDNQKIYDRALRYLTGQKHRSDDLPYVSGPPKTGSQIAEQSNDYMTTYQLTGRQTTIEDYGYDEQLQYYIYPNGQCQEACRDQGHTLCGVMMYVDIAEIAWNQGDDIYGMLDNRLLKGIEWAFRYNYSYLEDFPGYTSPWEPSGFTTNKDRVTYDNGLFLRTRTRSGRWESVNVSPDGRGDGLQQGGARECALAHYAVRLGLPADQTDWLTRSRDYMISNYDTESWGKPANWYYEWKGWGTLTKRLEPGMAGTPGHFETDGSHTSALPVLPTTLEACDYDLYALPGATGHTCFTSSPQSNFRPDSPGVAIDPETRAVVLRKGDKLRFTVNVPEEKTYEIVPQLVASTEKSRAPEAAEGPKTTVNLSKGVQTLEIEAPEDMTVAKFKIQEYSPTTSATLSSETPKLLMIYDLNGRPATDESTIVIKRYSDGKTVKTVSPK